MSRVDPSHVSFGNEHEFLDGDKVEQQTAEGCKRLIKNAILSWNFLFVTQLIAREPDPGRRLELLDMVKHGSRPPPRLWQPTRGDLVYVPKPSSTVLLLLGAFALLARRRMLNV